MLLIYQGCQSLNAEDFVAFCAFCTTQWLELALVYVGVFPVGTDDHITTLRGGRSWGGASLF